MTSMMTELLRDALVAVLLCPFGFVVGRDTSRA